MTSAWDLDSRFREAVAALTAAPGSGISGSTGISGSDGTTAGAARPVDADASALGADGLDIDRAVEPVTESDHTLSGSDSDDSDESVADLTDIQILDLFEAQLASRQIDLATYWLRSWKEGYHSVSSAGHEAAAAVAAALRPTDPALLYPRSGAFYCARAGQVPASDPVLDVLAAVVGAATEPMAGGRHEPFGSRVLSVLPTSSNGSSHLPRSVGVAFGLQRGRRLGVLNPLDLPEDSVVLAAFGGTEVSHATTSAALNGAGWCAYAGLPLPLLFLCQDDSGPGTGWVTEVLRSRPRLRYLTADGCRLRDTYRAAREAVEYVRRRRRPAVLHVTSVRLMDHFPGADLSRDPLLATARLLVRRGMATPDEVLARYDDIGWKVRQAAERMVAEPKLASAREVTSTLSPRRPLRVAQTAALAAEPDVRAAAFPDKLPEDQGPLTLSQAINRTLADALAAYPRLVVFGPQAVSGGAHGVTEELRDRFGAARVFDTFPDETSVLGLASGSALAGLLPVAEIPRLAQLHNAAGQLRDEVAPTQFWSQGAYRNPLVIRVAGFAAADGNGGHTQNENGIGALREIPGLLIATPGRPDDAASMLRTCIAAASTDGSCSVFLEPAPLYHTQDLYAEGDSEWLAPYPAPDQWGSGHVPVGRARVYGTGGDLTVVTYGDGLWGSLRVSARLAAEGIGSRVVDLRWLAPLPLDDVVREAGATGRVLVVDEARRSGGVADALVAALLAGGFTGRVATLSSEDSYVPLGPAAAHVLVSEPAVEQAARMLVAQPL